jgi:hypothetical protein
MVRQGPSSSLTFLTGNVAGGEQATGWPGPVPHDYGLIALRIW